MTTTPASTRWWTTASNPACTSWCEGKHPVDEFASTAALLCTASLYSSPAAQVEVQQWRGVNDDPDETFIVHPATVWVCSDEGEMPPAEALQVAAALMTAARTAQEANR